MAKANPTLTVTLPKRIGKHNARQAPRRRRDGTLAIEIARTRPDAAVTGIDADPRMLDKAAEKRRRARVKATFTEAMAQSLPHDPAIQYHRRHAGAIPGAKTGTKPAAIADTTMKLAR